MAQHPDHPADFELERDTLTQIMNEIEMCMLTTTAPDGRLHSRPMANNHMVEWDGTGWFFTYGDSSQAQEVEASPYVNLSYALRREILFISVTGRAEIVRDDAKKRELWREEFYEWFAEGPDHDNVVLIKVEAEEARMWDKGKRGELRF